MRTRRDMRRKLAGAGIYPHSFIMRITETENAALIALARRWFPADPANQRGALHALVMQALCDIDRIEEGLFSLEKWCDEEGVSAEGFFREMQKRIARSIAGASKARRRRKRE